MLHAGVEDFELETLRGESFSVRNEIRIAYAGTILSEPEFHLFVDALNNLRASLSQSIRLDLFGAHSYSGRPWFNPAWMREHGDLPELELRNRLRECTWGFSSMGLSDDNPRYNRFSFPTKFITYLAAGIPVITLAHPKSSLARMAGAYALGPIATAGSAAELAADLRTALADPAPHARYRQEIIRCADTEFSASRMRTTLYSCFQCCAAKNSIL